MQRGRQSEELEDVQAEGGTPFGETMTPASCKALGFPYSDNIIYMFVGGSQLHGAKLEGTDDSDFYGVYIEPPRIALGVDAYEHFVYSTSGQRGKNTKDDIDITLYSLRKWARLAVKGNPSVLHFLFARGDVVRLERPAWTSVRQSADIFLARSHLSSFLGYGNAQLARLQNARSKDTNRPYLETLYGYDTKYAMHIVRLMYEAWELMKDGWITLPRPERAMLIDIRTGKYTLPTVIEKADAMQREAIAAQALSPLPERIDRKKISALISEIHLNYWRDNAA